MAKRAKKKAAEKQEWRLMREVQPLLDELVKRQHKHLERAKIVVIGKPKATRRLGRTIYATARRATTLVSLLMKELGEHDVHYVIEIGLDQWDVQDMKRKKAILDHELCHFTGQDGETGKWGMRDHDVEEFTEILRRHGAWDVSLALFCKEAKQLALEGV